MYPLVHHIWTHASTEANAAACAVFFPFEIVDRLVMPLYLSMDVPMEVHYYCLFAEVL
jgi:hypothetical protein